MSLSILVDRNGTIKVRHGCTKETHFIDIVALGNSHFTSFFSEGDNAEVAQLKATIAELEQELKILRYHL